MQGASRKNKQEILVPVGDLEIRLRAPCSAEDPSDRISLWWGITSAAVVLARHMEAQGPLAGTSLLELGCGLGLPGIVAALRGTRVTFTDYVPEALGFAQENCRINGLTEDQATFRMLDWEHPEPMDPFDWVIGSEIMYDYFFHGALTNLLCRLVKTEGTVILSDRKRLCISRFIGRARGKSFTCQEILSRAGLPDFPDQEISLFTLRPARE
jgi:predicted nicotinamide N-methyase